MKISRLQSFYPVALCICNVAAVSHKICIMGGILGALK